MSCVGRGSDGSRTAAELLSGWDYGESVDAAITAVEGLKEHVWAKPLLGNLDQARESGDRRQYRSYLWEARVGFAIQRIGYPVHYEYKSGQGGQSIDFRVMSRPELLMEAIAIQNSESSERAGWIEECGPGLRTYGINLTSWNPDQRETTAGEMVRVVELLAGKAQKFPLPRTGVYHLLIADIRGYNAGEADYDDCNQIAWGPAGVRHEANRQFFGSRPVRGIFDPENTRSTAVRAQQRIHAVGLLCRAKSGLLDVLSTRVSVWRANPLLISNRKEAAILASVLDATSGVVLPETPFCA